MKTPNRNLYDTCHCGATKKKSSKQCRRCNDRDKEQRVTRNAEHCSKCGWILTGARHCPRCVYGASMTWEQVACVYVHLNPDDPQPPRRCKAIVENILYRLRMAVDRDTDVGRVLLGCLRDLREG